MLELQRIRFAGWALTEGQHRPKAGKKKRPAKRVFFFWFPLHSRCSIRKGVTVYHTLSRTEILNFLGFITHLVVRRWLHHTFSRETIPPPHSSITHKSWDDSSSWEYIVARLGKRAQTKLAKNISNCLIYFLLVVALFHASSQNKETKLEWTVK